MTIKHNKVIASVVTISAALVSVPAWAHHAMDGATPTTPLQGLLSGLAHPVLGMDHLLFVLAIGLISGIANLRWPWLPMLFVVSTVLGAAPLLAGFNFVFAEACVAASIIAAAALLLRNATTSRTALIVFGVGAGLFHGYVYAETIIGAEASPLVAYLLGFALIQMLLSSAAYAAGLGMTRAYPGILTRIKVATGATLGLTGIALLSSRMAD